MMKSRPCSWGGTAGLSRLLRRGTGESEWEREKEDGRGRLGQSQSWKWPSAGCEERGEGHELRVTGGLQKVRRVRA